MLDSRSRCWTPGRDVGLPVTMLDYLLPCWAANAWKKKQRVGPWTSKEHRGNPTLYPMRHHLSFSWMASLRATHSPATERVPPPLPGQPRCSLNRGRSGDRSFFQEHGGRDVRLRRNEKLSARDLQGQSSLRHLLCTNRLQTTWPLQTKSFRS